MNTDTDIIVRLQTFQRSLERQYHGAAPTQLLDDTIKEIKQLRQDKERLGRIIQHWNEFDD